MSLWPEFLKEPLRRVKSDMHPPGVSRVRKILIWILIIGFWLAFYWFNDSASP